MLQSSGLSRMTRRSAVRSDEKDPRWWDHAGVSYARIPLGRGALGDGERPAFLSLSLAIFQGCIKQLTLSRRWTSGSNFPPVSAGEAQSAGDNRPGHGAKKPPSLQLKSRIGRRICEIALRACPLIFQQSRAIVSRSPRPMLTCP
jgi:hypothetical protein